MKKILLFSCFFVINLMNLNAFAVNSLPGEQIMARVSGPGVFMRGVPQNFPYSTYLNVFRDKNGLPSEFSINMNGIGIVRLPVSQYSSINTPVGTRAFQALMAFLKNTKPGTQLFVECKDPNGCAVVCNNPAGGGCNSVTKNFHDFKGAYRITLYGSEAPSIPSAKPVVIATLPFGAPLFGTVRNYTPLPFDFTLNTNNGIVFFNHTDRVNEKLTTSSSINYGMKAVVMCWDPIGCQIKCEDPNGTQCKTARGVQGIFYKFSGKHKLNLFN